jgi:hypothetical protein
MYPLMVKCPNMHAEKFIHAAEEKDQTLAPLYGDYVTLNIVNIRKVDIG